MSSKKLLIFFGFFLFLVKASANNYCLSSYISQSKIQHYIGTDLGEICTPICEVPILNSLTHGIPLLKKAISRPLDEYDLGMMSTSLGMMIEIGIWKIYDKNGHVLAQSSYIFGDNGSISDGNMVYNTFVDLWNRSTAKNANFSKNAIAITFTHTHPPSNDFSLSSVSRFSKADNLFSSQVSKILKSTKQLSNLSFEMFILYESGFGWGKQDRLRKIGYQQH